MFGESFKASLASLALRVGLGTIFIYHGWGKVFAPEHRWGTKWHDNLEPILQAAVAWGELLGGVALLIGFLTPVAAAGIIAIMAGAIAQVHGKHGFGLPKGYEYNFALIIMCVALILIGSGSFAIDRFIFRKGKKA